MQSQSLLYEFFYLPRVTIIKVTVSVKTDDVFETVHDYMDTSDLFQLPGHVPADDRYKYIAEKARHDILQIPTVHYESTPVSLLSHTH